MYCFETEVLALWNTKTEALLKKYHIYAHHEAQPKAMFMTFYGEHGVMDTLYKVDLEVVADPHRQSFGQLPEISRLPEPEKTRILRFVEERQAVYPFDRGEKYHFFILSEKEKIALPHRPHARSRGAKYFSLTKLLSGEKIVDPIGNTNR